ncbi:type VII secretion-associated protein [Gordonia jinghuaiqii]|uniref:Type VII secretion-associated protein n=1 Tax=Gordonia jinghuaiqii TaxID=2758710 RepID=A0A7D7QHP4_9ACTN|nr:type VII secretion-associated protein [Gordonia jinghuaiqii]MCR5978756.1 type VII secretion-associated protein [Gordonia jinghuaiqii]QMT03062.1 type VII secretion-associated protein [Gordonia jinghuaiqii]
MADPRSAGIRVPGSARADPGEPIVVDLAFGRPRIWEPDTGLRHPDRDVRYLLDNVDEMTVVLDGQRAHTRQAWQRVFAGLGLAASGDRARPMIVGHPSTWGHRRASSLADAGGRVPVELVPRAVLIARSHADLTVQRCAVVETTHIPQPPADPAHPRPAVWDVQIVRRRPEGWTVERSGVIDHDTKAKGTQTVSADRSDPVGESVVSVVDDTVEAVFVDGDDPAEVSSAIELIAAHAIAGRVVAVDRDLVVRHGRRTGGTADDAVPVTRDPATVAAATAGPRVAWRDRRVLVGAAAMAALVVIGATAVGVWQRDTAPAAASSDVALGRAAMTVPSDWRQTEQDTPSDTTDDPTTSRAVFVDADDGRRIIAVLTELRSGSTRESVATSLRNRIDQRGDAVVTEFSAATRYAGRDVISYREAPASGGAIRWYVVVDGGLQLSIGCQAGTAAEPVDAECAQAVRSIRVGQ